LPKPAQSESEPQLEYGTASMPNTAAGESVVIDASTRDVSGPYCGTGCTVEWAAERSLAPQEVTSARSVMIRIRMLHATARRGGQASAWTALLCNRPFALVRSQALGRRYFSSFVTVPN
jgi:hypothetical protein